MKKNASLFPASPEALEPRIAPAGLVSFVDVDGDLVTVKSSHGTTAPARCRCTPG